LLEIQAEAQKAGRRKRRDEGLLTRSHSLCHCVSGENGDSYAIRQLSCRPT